MASLLVFDYPAIGRTYDDQSFVRLNVDMTYL